MQRVRQLIFPVQLIFSGFSHRGKPRRDVIFGVFAFSAFQAALVLVGSYIDGTWWMSNGGKGLSVHYGEWAILISDPLLLISASFAWYQFRVAFRHLPVRDERANPRKIRSIVKPYQARVTLKGEGILFYAVCACVGMLSWLNNIRETRDPVKYFGHNVFNSADFIYGFLANKFVLFTSWVLIYPAVGFVVVYMCISTFLILRELRNKKLIEPNLLHPDGCYGFSSLGKLNIFLLLPYFFSFFVAFSILITHENLYPSLVLPLAFLTSIFFFVSIITVKPILSLVKSGERKYYLRLVEGSTTLNGMKRQEILRFGQREFAFQFPVVRPTPVTQNGFCLQCVLS